MIEKDHIVLIDTCVIFEAHRVNCWNNLANQFKLVTVEKVIEETQNGYQNRAASQTINEQALRASFHHIEPITDIERAEFSLNYDIHMDDGEKDLAIFALRLPDTPVWYLNSPDNASVRFAHSQKWLDRMVSLEEMAGQVNARTSVAFKGNYTSSWLSQAKLEFLLGRK